MSVKPLKPSEIKPKPLPDFVIIAFNELLSENFTTSGSVTITQDEAIDKIIAVTGRIDHITPISREDIFDNNWLDVEEVYREVGWDVTYDKPAYYENYKAFFKFKK